MVDTTAAHEPARDPQDLERMLVARQRAGDLEGMVALYEPDAVLNIGDGRLVRGLAAIRAQFAASIESGRKFQIGVQSPATISGDLALTSTLLPDGTVTGEVARRQGDGTWLWVIDRFSVAQVEPSGTDQE
jgi:ketosteroid isomerase-like protein